MSYEPPQQPGQPEYGQQPPSYPPPPPAPPASYPPPPQPGYAPPPAAPPAYGQQPPVGQPGYPPAQPYSASASKGFSFNPAAVNPMDWAILGIAFLVLVFSTFDYYTVSVSFSGVSQSDSESAWHGFFGWFAVLVALVSAGLVAVELFLPQVKLPVPIRLASLIGWAVATLCVLLALVVFPESVPSGLGIDTGRGFGYWVSLILVIAGVVLSVLRLKATGGKLPWEKGGSSTGGTPAGGYPAAGGYPPAQPQYPPAQQYPPNQPPYPQGPPPPGYPNQ